MGASLLALAKSIYYSISGCSYLYNYTLLLVEKRPFVAPQAAKEMGDVCTHAM